jgi:hypothetical protein
MSLDGLLTTRDIKDIFAEEISAAGGTVSDTFDDGERLFVRSVVPQVREVRAADQLQGGVALRADDHDVWIHPYVFRLVCRNGAIIAQALQTRQIECQQFVTPDEAAGAIRSAIQACADEETFLGAVQEIRSAIASPVDLALNLLPMLARLPTAAATEVFRSIVERFYLEPDRSRFSLMNAVTALARDTADPELRWRLEELGGGIPAGRPLVRQPDDRAAANVLVG